MSGFPCGRQKKSARVSVATAFLFILSLIWLAFPATEAHSFQPLPLKPVRDAKLNVEPKAVTLEAGSRASKQVPGRINPHNIKDLFWFDHATGLTTVTSHLPAGTLPAAGGAAVGFNQVFLTVRAADGNSHPFTDHFAPQSQPRYAGDFQWPAGGFHHQFADPDHGGGGPWADPYRDLDQGTAVRFPICHFGIEIRSAMANEAMANGSEGVSPHLTK